MHYSCIEKHLVYHGIDICVWFLCTRQVPVILKCVQHIAGVLHCTIWFPWIPPPHVIWVQETSICSIQIGKYHPLIRSYNQLNVITPCEGHNRYTNGYIVYEPWKQLPAFTIQSCTLYWLLLWAEEDPYGMEKKYCLPQNIIYNGLS